MKKIYQVIIQDEYDDLYHIGFYKNLKDSLPDVNEFLFNCYDITIDELKEYPSTWEYVFDTEVEVDIFDFFASKSATCDFIYTI